MSAGAAPAMLCTDETHEAREILIDHGRVGGRCLVLGVVCECGGQVINLWFDHDGAADFHARLGEALAGPHETEPRARP